jgi:hypothetical protein
VTQLRSLKKAIDDLPAATSAGGGSAMLEDVAWVSLSVQPATLGSCELCGGESERPGVVTVQHTRGGAVQLASCDFCLQAVRRLAAVAGDHARFRVAEGALPSSPRTAGRPRSALVGTPELIHERPERLIGLAGTEYLVRVWGQPRADGTMVGWLEFVAVGARDVRHTGQETSQPNRGALAYWATGLEAAYLEGAFARARAVVA